MSRFRRIFTAWFLILMALFVFGNLYGFVRPGGLKPFHFVGFPFIYAARGVGVEDTFRWWALGLNALIALSVSGLLALLCAAWRCWRIPSRVMARREHDAE